MTTPATDALTELELAQSDVARLENLISSLRDYVRSFYALCGENEDVSRLCTELLDMTEDYWE